MNDVIARCDICLPSEENIVAITSLTDPDALVDHCLHLGATTVPRSSSAPRVRWSRTRTGAGASRRVRAALATAPH
jgi:hypothetical protein